MLIPLQLEFITTPEAVPKTFNEKDHKKPYLVWDGMLKQVSEHVNLDEIETSVRELRRQDPGSGEDENIEIPHVPLVLNINDLK